MAQYTRSTRCTLTNHAWAPADWRALPARHQPVWPDAAEAGARRRGAADDAAARLRGRGASPGGGARRGRARAGVPPPGGRLRRVVPRLLRRLDPREAEDLPADVGRDDLRLGAAAREGRPDRGPVRASRARRRRSGRRPRAPVVPRAHGQRRRADARGADARSRAAAARLPPVRRRRSTSLRAFTKGGFADLDAGARVEPGVRRESPEGQRYEALAAEIERALDFVAALRDRPRRRSGCTSVDLWTSHEGLAARLRGGADAARLADRRLVRLLGAHALDRRAHAPARTARTSSSSPASTTRSASSSARRRRRTRSSSCASGSTRRAAREADADRADGGASAWSTRCRRSCAPSGTPGTRWCGRPTRCTRTCSAPRRGSRPAASTRSWTRSTRSSPSAATEGVWPGGVHIEFTGEDVTECVGGSAAVLEEELTMRYESLCDPRLNARQSLDLAFRVGELMRDGSSAGVAERRGDPGDRAEKRPRRALVPGAVCAQELDLDRVHRVDVRVPQPHRPLDHRMAVEQRLGLDDRQHRFDGARVLRLERRPRSGPGRRSAARARGSRAAISKLDFASVISRFSTSARKNGHSR